MDDGTAAFKTCDVCGDPIRPDNTYGVCSTKFKPACREEYGRRRRRRHPQETPRRPRLASCEICAKPLNASNKSGLCDGKNSPECRKERSRRRAERKATEVKADPRADAATCDVCGARLNRGNRFGVCGDPWKPECRRERKRRKELGLIPGPQGPAITAGDVFGRWTALEDARIETMFIWCRCQCGNVRHVFGRNLILQISRDCGCNYRKEAARKRFPDPYLRAGFKSGRLTLLEDVWRAHDGARCLCECDSEAEVAVPDASRIKSGNTKSCGCLKREGQTTHGLSKHPLFGTWRKLVRRCTNPDDAGWVNYGGDGIKVCDRWLDPAAFIEDIEREIGPRPPGRHPGGLPKFTLDRIDNDGDYEAGNVKWSTQSEQVKNQRKTVPRAQQPKAMAARIAELEAALEAARTLLAEGTGT